MKTPTLTTKRLTLRAPTQDDLSTYTAFNAVSDTTVGAYRRDKSPDQVQQELDRDIHHWTKGFGMFLLGLPDGEIIGGAGLIIPRGWDTHELTWWLMPASRRFGYATEASLAVITFAYDTLNWRHVETMMRDENLPARQLAIRLGGQIIRRQTFPDGIARDVFALPRVTAKATV
ncbi:MAG: GNAT family N-acetyltransferase [Rhodobacteraceae bacterium]|nr:GNAT family N-acetyltransferase [Paracoccaceae bacterium]